MKKIILAFLLAAILLLCACGNNSSSSTPDSKNATEEKVEAIATPYTDIYVPAAFKDNVNNEVTSKDPYTLTFKAAEDDTVIFSLIFNGDGKKGTLVGTLIGENENTVVYLDMPGIPADNPNYETYCGYQEDSTTLIAHLSDDHEFIKNEIIESENQETFDIKTDVVTLKYPKKWEDKIAVETDEKSAVFSSSDTPLFAFYFNDEESGYLLGRYKDVPISFTSFDIDKEKFDETEYQELALMQDDANVMLDYLEEDENFTMREMK